MFLGVPCKIALNKNSKNNKNLILWTVLPAETWFTFLSENTLFRFFDIVKPWPVGYLDQKLRGGFGIMLDDFVAAVYTTACILLVSRFYPFIIGTG